MAHRGRLRNHIPGRRADLPDRDGARDRRTSALVQGLLARNAASARHPVRLARRVRRSQVWNDFEQANVALQREASTLRAVVLLTSAFPPDTRVHLQALVGRHIENTVTQEWPDMAAGRASLKMTPASLAEALQTTLA